MLIYYMPYVINYIFHVMFYTSHVVRFLLGLGAGLEITISPVYIHETTMRDMRDICGSFPQVVGHTYLSYDEDPNV